MSPNDEQSPHRLFAAIVLMGTGLAAGCGGIAEREREVTVAGGPSANTAGSTGATSGGTGVTGTGGAVQTPPISIAGTMSFPEPEPNPPPLLPVEPGPFICPPQLWDCTTTACDYDTLGLLLPQGCGCDDKRPLSASDCEAGQAFTCQKATATSDGRPFTKPVPFSCACVPKIDTWCNSACFAAYESFGDVRCESSEDELSILCGCAIPYLK
jgi:hypothetical protein